MKRITHILIGFCLLVLSGSAAAVAINGTLNIGGGSKVINNGTTALGINFNCLLTCGSRVNSFPAPTGVFSGLGGLNTGIGGGLTMYNFLFTDIPSKTIWSISHNGLLYSFTLNSVQIISGNSGNFSTLVLAGSGFFRITNSDGSSAGYTDTSGKWIYSQSGGSFSSQTVPEPGTIALFGLGLVGIGVANRLRKMT